MHGELAMPKRPCIRVSKTYGEQTIVLIKRLGLVNPELRVQHGHNYLYIPLIREPQSNELKDLKANLPKFKILKREFLERAERPLTLVDLLGDKLPQHLLASVPHAIDFVGDIAVVEILPELEDYKAIVGKAILATHKRLSTVLAKSSAVSGEYRVREFETIAGVKKTKTVHREYGCVFHVDLAKAYFSPRLSYEHNRVASLVEEDETVLDMFAGVGPFSILIAKKHKKVHVYAVDKNPEAIQLLKKNIIVNRVEAKITPLLGEAEQIVAEKLKGSSDRVIMNLPEKAIEYVDAACEAIKPDGGIIHCYEFTSAPEPLETAKIRLAEAVKQTNRELKEILHSRIVRGTAPFTWQIVVDATIK
jgi:tRNA (guanine37-N1)-methyltransferase